MYLTMKLRFWIVFFNISDTMVSNDPWSPLAGGQDSSTVLGGNDAWGDPAAAVTGIILQNIFDVNLLSRK